MALFIVERVGTGFTVRNGDNALKAAASALAAAASADEAEASAAAAHAGVDNYFDTIAAGVAGTAVDGFFASAESGSTRIYKCTGTSPFYVDQGDAAAPATKALLAASGGAGLIGFSHAATYPAGTMGAKFKQFISVKDAPFNAVGDGVTDDTAAFNAAIAAHSCIWVPAGTYLLEDVSLASNKCITLDRGAILKGKTTGSTIFVSSSFTTDVEFIGGEVSDCACFYEHTGDSAVAYSSFRFIRFKNITTVFDLSSSVGNDWLGCLFGVNGAAGNIGRGIYCRATGTGQTNLNNIQWCKFLLFGIRAIDFADTSIVKVKNTVTQCWFEDGNAGAISIGGSAKGTTIRDCYFETNNSADPDILLVQSVGSTIHSTDISANEFASSGALQTCRIRNTGNSYFQAHDNSVALTSGQVFAEINGSGSFHSQLRNNYLNAVGGDTYQSRLFSRSGTQMVSWDVAVGSGLVTDDDQPSEYWAGRRVQNVETFTSGDTTPSVRKGNFFKTAGTTTITTFDDGVDGQIVWVRAGNTITVVGVPMVLGDVQAFLNTGGTWEAIKLTLNAGSEFNATTAFKVGGAKVVGAQGAAVADATGAGDVVAQLNALLARLRAHGLIAT